MGCIWGSMHIHGRAHARLENGMHNVKGCALEWGCTLNRRCLQVGGRRRMEDFEALETHYGRKNGMNMEGYAWLKRVA
jgi:hypothetical protein